jgi:serine/threonine-protein kinase
MVYSAGRDSPSSEDKPGLYLRRFDQLEAKPIAGTEGGISPFLSPDDRWVGFWVAASRGGRKLMRVSVDGGVAAALCDVDLPFGFSWGDDNQIVFAPGEAGGLLQVSADGGEPETLTIPDKSKDEMSHRLPYCLPRGKGVLFTILRYAGDVQPRVAVVELITRRWHILLEDAADARYIATGHLAFLRQGTLMVVPFDLGRLEVTGKPVPVVANVAEGLNNTWGDFDTAAGQFSISASGSLVYALGGILPDRQNSLVWVDHTGRAQPAVSY